MDRRKIKRLNRRARLLNRRIEAKWRRGEIAFAAFDWWLRTMSGV
jgi:hypothetical protein